MSDQNKNVYRFFEKCAYKDCSNGKYNGKHLYRFPLHTDERHHLQIRNSGKFLNLILISINIVYICNSQNCVSSTFIHVYKIEKLSSASYIYKSAWRLLSSIV